MGGLARTGATAQRAARSLPDRMRSSGRGPAGGRPGRWWRLTALLAAVAVALVAVVVGLVGLRTDTTPASFLPANDPGVAALDDAARSFGGDPVVVLVESARPRELFAGDQVEKLVAMEGALSRLPDTAVVYGPGSVINQIAGSAQNLLATLLGKRDALRAQAENDARATGAPPEVVAQTAQAAVAEFDLRYGSLLVRALPAGLPTVRNPAFVDKVVFDADGAPTAQMRFVVPSPTAAAVLIRPRQGLDQAGTETLVQRARATVESAGLATTRVTVTGSPAVAAELGAAVEKEIPILGGLAVGLIAACYAFSPWTRRRRRRVLPLAATLAATAVVLAAFGWLGRPLSVGVVAFLPILIGIGSDFPAYVVHGVRRRVVVVTALASAAGFAALALSPLPFVRDLGLALGAGVLVALAIGLLFRRYLIEDQDGSAGEEAVPAPRTGEGPSRERVRPAVATRPLWQRLGALAVAAAIGATGWLALPGLEVAARPDQLAAGLPAVSDAQYAEEVLGSSGEVQILLQGEAVATPEALAWMRSVEDTTVLRFGSRLHPIVSPPALLRFLGPDPSPAEIRAALELVPPYLSGSVLRSDGRAAVLSFGIELQDINDQKVLLDAVRDSLPPTPPGMRASVVGLPVAAARGFELVSADRYLTNLGGIVAAGLVLLVGLRRRVDALRAVAAAVLATGWGLALTWLLALPLSPLTVSLGSLTTVTACEFTMMLTRSTGGGHGGRGVWRTVAVAAGAAALGYLALAASGLAVIREFGLLLAASVALSFLAAHLLWRLFPPSTPDEPDSSDSPDETAVELPDRGGMKEVAR